MSKCTRIYVSMYVETLVDRVLFIIHRLIVFGACYFVYYKTVVGSIISGSNTFIYRG